jgi:hypothetical protein
VPEAVVVEFECGFALDESVSPPDVTVPPDVLAGIELMIGELYSHRTLSVHSVHNTPSAVQLSRLWRQVP